MMMSRFIAAALCVLGLLTCTAYADGINGEDTYVSFQVPGALGTYPMSINNSMTVTGYYYVTPTQTRGFVRDADGTITTFDVDVAGAVWIEPESINARGDITGFYRLAAGVPQGFLRYAEGRVITFDPPPPVSTAGEDGYIAEAQPVSISDFDDIVGNYPFYSRPAVFTRTAAGVYDIGIGWDRVVVATAINWAGSVVGYSSCGSCEGSVDSGFLLHPDGYRLSIAVPAPPPGPPNYCGKSSTIPEGVNAAGVIAGWYVIYDNNCTTVNTGGFVMSPDGVYTLFQPPGAIAAPLSPGLYSTDPHWFSINQDGDIAGSYTGTGGVQHGFVRNQYGTITSFDPTEGKQTTATSINDAGAVAGFYHYNEGGGPPVGFIRVLVVPLQD